jgi:8-oxo-dGTP pyrophosphatase MutT (NUDIX family)
MTRIAVSILLRRGQGTRCTGAWEAVHGHIEAGESPADAARRELMEETGLTPDRWYNLSRVETFYQHRLDEVAMVPVFVALMGERTEVTLSGEHDDAEWLGLPEAAERCAWPRERRAMDDIRHLLRTGHAGTLDDVLRIL